MDVRRGSFHWLYIFNSLNRQLTVDASLTNLCFTYKLTRHVDIAVDVLNVNDDFASTYLTTRSLGRSARYRDASPTIGFSPRFYRQAAYIRKWRSGDEHCFHDGFFAVTRARL